MANHSKNPNRFTVILEEEEEGVSVYCPALPGCVSQGDDRESALENIAEAIELVLDVNSEPVHPEVSAASLANEIRELLEGRKEDGLPFSGISIVEVEVAARAIQ